MNPTQEQLNARVAATTPTISADTLTNPPTPIKIPAYTPPPVVPFVPALQNAVDNSLNDIKATTDKLGTASTRKVELEDAQGIPAINSRIAELDAIDAQYGADLTNLASRELQNEVTADNATNYAPLRNALGARETRINIQKQQNINIKRATNAAARAAANGQLALAQDYVSRALEMEFEPLKAKLEFQKLLYTENKDRFSEAEQRDYEASIKSSERQYEEKKASKEQTLSFATAAAQNGAPSSVISRAMSFSPEDALDVLAPYLANPNADLERQLMQAQIRSTNALTNNRASGGSGGMTDYQSMNAFLNISNKYQADPIVQQATKGATAVEIANQVLQNPDSATNQLKSLYVLVKNLDADSAVREGELVLASQTQSYFDTFSNSIARIQEGRVISPKAASELAQATIDLVSAWNASASNRQQAYISQANVAGVGSQFEQYLGGYNSNFSQQTPQPQVIPFDPKELNGITFADTKDTNSENVGAGGFINGVKNFFGI